jgi:alkyldihydroxyacetonephosphate synthase
MKRWNGWGDEEIEYPLPPTALAFLGNVLGAPRTGPTTPWPVALAGVPPSRLRAEHPLVSTDPAWRLRHARGQSLPDWVALRWNLIPRYPDGVAFPSEEADIADLFAFARRTGACLIPYGGGTSVVGHINPPADERPVLTVAMGRMRRLLHLDETARLATFAAGVTGPHLEAQLRAHGYTLGHFPQSFAYSTLGGWIATRSSGQQSLYYGRIEDTFAGGSLLTPVGRLDLPPFPASAAGPDLRQLVLGSEGRLGILTRATMRVRPLPEAEEFHAVFFPSWEAGLTAVRTLVQDGAPLSLLRLSDAVETATTLILAGHPRLLGALERLLRRRGLGEGKCLLIFAVTGDAEQVKTRRRLALAVAHTQGGVHGGRLMGNEWRRNRFRTPYLRNTLWDYGYAVDTLETALPWSALTAAHQAVLTALREALTPWGERVHAFAHVSHLYPTGAALYFTCLFRLASDPEQTLAYWQRLKAAAGHAILAHGGTISHQHGVGTDHLPYLAAEKGETGLRALAALARACDPDGMMNPGKLIPAESL